VPYLTGGLGDDWLETICAVAVAGADAIEIGVPFSDPVMDGTTIQQANDRALSEGATPQSILAAVRGAAADIGVPTAVMTYANIAHHMGYQRFAASLAEAGLSILIVEPFAQAVLGVANEAAIMLHGRIQRTGPPAEIAEELTAAYLGMS